MLARPQQTAPGGSVLTGPHPSASILIPADSSGQALGLFLLELIRISPPVQRGGIFPDGGDLIQFRFVHDLVLIALSYAGGRHSLRLLLQAFHLEAGFLVSRS